MEGRRPDLRQKTYSRPALQRRLAAIVSFDFVSYCRFVQCDEAKTLAAVEAIIKESIMPSLARYGGKLFKILGDGGLLEFESAVEATDWAVSFQESLQGSERARLPAGWIEFRVGIAVGDVIVRGSDRFGEVVALAVRVQETASPGSVALSDYVHQLIRGKTSTTFEDCGCKKLKNVVEPMRVWQWLPATKAVTPDTTVVPMRPFSQPSLVQSDQIAAPAYPLSPRARIGWGS
jgi:class 3 adenylate cyclase